MGVCEILSFFLLFSFFYPACVRKGRFETFIHYIKLLARLKDDSCLNLMTLPLKVVLFYHIPYYCDFLISLKIHLVFE